MDNMGSVALSLEFWVVYTAGNSSLLIKHQACILRGCFRMFTVLGTRAQPVVYL